VTLSAFRDEENVCPMTNGNVIEARQ